MLRGTKLNNVKRFSHWPSAVMLNSILHQCGFVPQPILFVCECKINKQLITAILSFPRHNSLHFKDYRNKHLQRNVWGKLACIVGVDGELDCKRIDFSLFIFNYRHLITPVTL